MLVSSLGIQKESISSNDSLFDFLQKRKVALPVVENKKLIGYLTTEAVFKKSIPSYLYQHADGISRNPGHLEGIWDDLLNELKRTKVNECMTPSELTIDAEDPTIKALCEMMEHSLPLIAVTKNNEYIGYVDNLLIVDSIQR